MSLAAQESLDGGRVGFGTQGPQKKSGNRIQKNGLKVYGIRLGK